MSDNENELYCKYCYKYFNSISKQINHEKTALHKVNEKNANKGTIGRFVTYGSTSTSEAINIPERKD